MPRSQPFDQQTSQRAGRVPSGAAGLQRLPRPVRSVRPGARQLRQLGTLPDRRRRSAVRSTRTPRCPPRLGGGAVANAVELAQKLATSPAFTNCMARTLLQYAMVDPATSVEVPLPPQQAGLRDRRRRPAIPARQRQDLRRSRARDGGRARVRAAEGGAMTSYRFRRRAFITAISGGVGLKIMLRNLESSAQGMRSPAPPAGHALAGRDRGGRQATRCGSRRRAAWAAPRRSSRSPTRASGPT